ncbi:vesicular inhibitory amino acid transporter-like [Genypterus blacodes]|uniref:vesicular inhibitory amino acid transporter-like n=1 Tax=Genypterus blacodes TaxID=154954 RepID=UPI003F76382A
MGSLRWARRSGRPPGAAGSLWGWVASRLQLDWTTRFFQDGEEMVVLTQSDELNQTYTGDYRSPLNNVTNTSPSLEDTRKARPSSGESSLDLNEHDNRPEPNLTEPTCTTWQDRPGLKDTRATVILAGPRTITITSAVSTPDSLWVKTRRDYARGRSGSIEMQADKTFSEENLRFNQKIQERYKKKPYRLAGELRWNIQNRRCADKEEGDELVEGSPQISTSGGGLSPPPTITTWEAGWNVTNAIQGIFVLGLPFALVRSGYLGLALLVLSAWVCNHTGKILVSCLYEEEEQSGQVVRVRSSYQDVVEACCRGLCPKWSGPGGWIINVAQVIELMMTCTLYLVVSNSLLSDSLSGLAVPPSGCSLVSLVFLLPCLLLTDLRPVSTLSLLCSLAHMLISLLVILYCLSRASSWSWSSLPLSVDPEDFLVSVGVIIFSYTSQIFLPPLEGSMEDRGRFNAMLGWTHVSACIMKTTFSLLAVLTWGAETREVITDNLPSDLRPLVNLCLLAKALLSYPLPFYSAAEILQSCLLGDAAVSPSSKCGGRGVSRPALLLRAALLMTSYLLALLVPRFSLLMGLTGSVTGAAMTLILPCLFHLRLQWGRLAAKDRAVDVCILSAGGVCSVSGVICSLKRLLEGL